MNKKSQKYFLIILVWFGSFLNALAPGEVFENKKPIATPALEYYALPMVFDDCSKWKSQSKNKDKIVKGYQCNPAGALQIDSKKYPNRILGSKKSQSKGRNGYTTSSSNTTDACKYFNQYYLKQFRGKGLCQDGYNYNNSLVVLNISQSDLNKIKDIVSTTKTGLKIDGLTPADRKELELKFLTSPGFLLETTLTSYAPQNYEQKLHLIRTSDLKRLASSHGKTNSSGSVYLESKDIASLETNPSEKNVNIWSDSIIIKSSPSPSGPDYVEKGYEEDNDKGIKIKYTYRKNKASVKNIMRKFAELKCRKVTGIKNSQLIPSWGSSSSYKCKITREAFQKKVQKKFTINKDANIIYQSCNEIFLNRGDKKLKNGVYKLSKVFRYYRYKKVKNIFGGYFTVDHNPEISDGQYVYLIVDGKLYNGVWWDAKYRKPMTHGGKVHVRFDGPQMHSTFTWKGQDVIVIPKRHQYMAASINRTFVPSVNDYVLDVSKNAPGYPITKELERKFNLGIKDYTYDENEAFYFRTTENAYCDMETDGGGWTLVASAVPSDRSVWKNMRFSGRYARTDLIPSLLSPYVNHMLYGSLSNATKKDYKGGGYLSIPFTEFMFRDSRKQWVSYEVSKKELSSLREWFPEDTFWVGNNKKPTMQNIKPNGLYYLKPKNSNMDESMNRCKSLDMGFNMEDSDGPYNARIWHDYTFGPSWQSKNNNSCYFDDVSSRWNGRSPFYNGNNSRYTLWFVRGRSENRVKKLYKTCLEILTAGKSKGNGYYDLDIDNSGYPTTTYCNMDTDGGGWTLVAKFSNHDNRHWSNDASIWTSKYIFGDPESTSKSDMKNAGWVSIPAREIMMLEDNNPSKAIWTTHNCTEDLPLSDFFTKAFASHNFTNFSYSYRRNRRITYYKACKVKTNYDHQWTRETRWGGGKSWDAVRIDKEIVIAKNDYYDTHGVISTFRKQNTEADVGLGALEWNGGFRDFSQNQDVGAPTSCSYNDTKCKTMYPQTIYMYVREPGVKDNIKNRQYHNCKQIQDTNKKATLKSDYYYVYSPKKNIRMKVWCEFTVKPALTLFRITNGIRTRRFTDYDTCQKRGYKIFAPKNKEELMAGIRFLEKDRGTFFDNSRTKNYEIGPLGIYHPTHNQSHWCGNCWTSRIKMTSEEAGKKKGWKSIRGSKWYLSEKTNVGEPNGDYYKGCWLGIWVNHNGVSHYNDARCHYGYTTYLCSDNPN